MSLGTGNGACDCPAEPDVALASDGLCDPVGSSIGAPCGAWREGKVAPLAPSTVACSETPTLPPVTYAAQGETCLLTGAGGGGCPSGAACVPAVAPGVACIAKQGALTTCPAGFTHLSVVFPPGDVTDDRQCEPCGCTSAATSCSGAMLTLYDQPGCATGAVAIAVDGGCDGISGDPSDAGWFTYSATPDTMSCSGPATAPFEGGVVTANPQTICCP
jgi:hypothetical protein